MAAPGAEALRSLEEYGIQELLEITAVLRGEGGCPWDAKQNHHSIRENFLEEACEVLEAIDNDDPVLLTEELGDVLFNVVFHAALEEEAGNSTFAQIVDQVSRKLILRHPHVFGESGVRDVPGVLNQWEAIKRASKGHGTGLATLLDVPQAFPALMRAQKLVKRGRAAGYENFDDPSVTLENLLRTGENGRVDGAMDGGDCESKEQQEKLLGEALLSLAAWAQKEGLQCETALAKACQTFISDFQQYEENCG